MMNIETFTFTTTYVREITFTIECIYESDQIMKFKVSAGNHFLILRCDYPLLQKSNSRKKIDWKVIEGKPKDGQMLLRLCNRIETALKDHGKMPYVHPKNEGLNKRI